MEPMCANCKFWRRKEKVKQKDYNARGVNHTIAPCSNKSAFTQASLGYMRGLMPMTSSGDVCPSFLPLTETE